MKNELSRRDFLGKTLTVGAAVPLLALVGCKSETKATEPAPADGTAAAPAGEVKPTCDLSEVPEGGQATRKALGYVEKSTTPDKNCANCNLFKADNGAGCPGCTLFPGPVAEAGYCNSWVTKG